VLLQRLVADVRKWISDVLSCLQQSSAAVDGIDGLQYELRESQVGSCSIDQSPIMNFYSSPSNEVTSGSVKNGE